MQKLTANNHPRLPTSLPLSDVESKGGLLLAKEI
jgi:hypothetical protein